jgi:D-alanyl-D-alanine carboxypeptidase
VLHGQPLPPPLAPAAPPTRVPNASDYAGVYTASDGRKLTLLAENEGLAILHDGRRILLEPRGPDAFYVDHPDFALFLLSFGREKGAVTEALHGPDWYTNERYKGPRVFNAPPEWKAYTGHYRTAMPWLSNFRIVLRKGRLWEIDPEGEESALSPAKGYFRVGNEALTAETLRFDTILKGEALRANLSGIDYYRTFTP